VGSDYYTGMAKLVARSRISVSGAEDDGGAVEVLAVFDHDYQAHVLVQEWDHTSAGPQWSYRLWFVSGDTIVPVHRFTQALWPHPPLVQAAEIAQEWRVLADALN